MSAFRVRWTVGIIRRLRGKEVGNRTKVAADVKCPMTQQIGNCTVTGFL